MSQCRFVLVDFHENGVYIPPELCAMAATANVDGLDLCEDHSRLFLRADPGRKLNIINRSLKYAEKPGGKSNEPNR